MKKKETENAYFNKKKRLYIIIEAKHIEWETYKQKASFFFSMFIYLYRYWKRYTV